MSERLVVMQAHVASYEDPIILKAGDPVTLTGRTELWDGHRWLWAAARDGREGWIPDNIVDHHAHGALAGQDYSAMELTCVEGDVLTGVTSTHGWTWCVSEPGGMGWVPCRNLKPT